jgi:hypothetical protein
MYRSVCTAIVTLGAATALTVGGVAPAFAADGSPASAATHAAASLSTIQQRGATLIAARLTSLGTAITRVTAAKDATASDRTKILDTLNSDKSGLTSLAAKIAADTSVATARADVASIFTTYRVYAVALPQSYIAIGADRIGDTAVPRLQSAHDRLQGRGADKAELAVMQNDINTAAQDVKGLDSEALAVTPAAFNADHSVMSAMRARLKDAIAHIKAAAMIGKKLVGEKAPQSSAPVTPSPAPSTDGAS